MTKFNKNDLLQNIIAREVIEHLNDHGSQNDHDVRVKTLARDEYGGNVLLSKSFDRCVIYPQYMTMIWMLPNGNSSRIQIKYDMLDPSFDPQLLIKTIIRFAKEAKRISGELCYAMGQVENEWYLEKRNTE